MKYNTLKQRLVIYKIMFKEYKQEPPQFSHLKLLKFQFGFCHYIALKFEFSVYGNFKEKLPELYKQRPKKKMIESGSWWVRGSLTPRVRALEKAIKLTEELILQKSMNGKTSMELCK